MPAKFRFLDPIIVVGILVSIGLALLLVLIGQDKAISLLIGLVMTVITLLIDLIAKQNESEKRIVQTFSIADGLAKATDAWLFDLLKGIVDNYHTVKKLDFETFAQKMETDLRNCHDAIHSLSEGELKIDVLDELSFRRSGIGNTRECMNLVQYADPSYWRGEYGKKYLKLNEAAIQNGVKITRIWLQNKDILESYYDLITAQAKIGVQVFIAETDNIPQKLRRDFGVIDNRIVVYPIVTVEGKTYEECISINPVAVAKAEKDFELLLTYSTEFEEYFIKEQNQTPRSFQSSNDSHPQF